MISSKLENYIQYEFQIVSPIFEFHNKSFYTLPVSDIDTSLSKINDRTEL